MYCHKLEMSGYIPAIRSLVECVTIFGRLCLPQLELALWYPRIGLTGGGRRITERFDTHVSKTTLEKIREKRNNHFDETQCGGVFDGNRVTSDADPGL